MFCTNKVVIGLILRIQIDRSGIRKFTSKPRFISLCLIRSTCFLYVRANYSPLYASQDAQYYTEEHNLNTIK